jgi:RNA polymerase sigma-70 factor, ECF subfamily
MDAAIALVHPGVFDPLEFSSSDTTRSRETGFSLRQMRDEALVSRIHSGNTEVFYHLVEPHLRSVRYLVRSLVRNQADLDDVVQDAILSAFTKIHQLRSKHLFRPWFIQIALNIARMTVRREKERGFTESLDTAHHDHLAPVHEQLVSHRDLPFRALEIKELREKIWEALDHLPPYYREAVVLRDIKQLSMRETAAALGLSLSLAKTRLHRARLKLREKLSPFWQTSASVRHRSTGRVLERGKDLI